VQIKLIDRTEQNHGRHEHAIVDGQEGPCWQGCQQQSRQDHHRQVIHPLYRKYFKQTKKVMAHDEENTCQIGDTVKVIESRPLSARKRWSLVEILERAQ
jgi:small subunit ribosomal protein S17